MINKKMIALLADPLTGAALRLSDDGKNLISKDEKYPIVEDVPRMVVGNPVESDSQVHSDMNSTFDYRDHYEKDAQVFNYFHEYDTPATKAEAKRLHQTIARKIPTEANVILDVGCGNGWLARYFLPKGKSVISMDISSINPVRIHKKVASDNHMGLVADVFQLPFAENSIDAIVASEIMEHVPDPTAFVQKLFTVLKPGGRLIITTPYNEKLQYHLCVHCNNPTPAHAHIHSFNENNISALIPTDAQWMWKAFSNRYLARIRSHVVLNILGYWTWHFADRIFNSLFGKQERLMLVIEKRKK